MKAVQELDRSLTELEELSPAQLICAKRASILFQSLDELGHISNMSHCQVDHVSLLRSSLHVSHALKEAGRTKEEIFLELTAHHTLAVFQRAAR